ncbi:hypothetical protein [Pimelobacter simplex]|uniref:hypothetical protein n=1 Tax=Nocardioides simplex TaxID=2045 RepID=UPI0021503036|nr:hypothetical protein [Pimelobacter simplex]UUW96489.1 hypothetical protein M0M48_03250 [Pimelobacter simplex]
MIHLLGVELLPPCIDPLLDAPDSALVDYVPGPWSPVLADVDCPECLQWIHA